ncbi:LysR family transcriptional regulator [Marinobacter fonticola]|uniref:LysR family transcriptional regulator n=1 Tax=Marinobacter fonticola TaxID=2603215 RepID=UPI00143DF19B|nr:LysR family transcriptional regulator [Marinobacter fonticola]
MNIQFEKLRSFVLIAEEKNLTRAAERRFSTPAAVSAQLKQLEDVLDLQLFERTSKGMLLTDAGCRLLPLANRILGNLAEFETTARAIAGRARTQLLFGLNALPELLRFESVLEASARELPDVSLVIRSSSSAENQKAVLAGELDAGFVFGGHDDPALRRIELGHISILTIGPASRDLGALSGHTRELALLPWISPSAECPYIELMRQRLGVHYAGANIVATSDDEYSTIAMVKAGLGLGLVESNLASMAACRGEVRLYENTAVRMPLYIVTRKDRLNQLPELEVFLQLVQDQWSCGQEAETFSADAGATPVASAS